MVLNKAPPIRKKVEVAVEAELDVAAEPDVAAAAVVVEVAVVVVETLMSNQLHETEAKPRTKKGSEAS
ncbi:hypothetical protein K1719_034940 [Acacia pycnantha]|nr:hypothetical protein K1719_034940 [Acacia pycnantha]